MMGIKIRDFAPLPELSLEELVPKDNFYRQLEQRLDLSFVRSLVEDRYAAAGRPSVDPEVFFRLQLVMFHEGIRSERELMRIVSDRISVRWYVGYDLFEDLPDHSSLTRIRDRFGLSVFREFFERIVELCIEAGLVWGEELYFDATKVDASASLDSIAPRFYVERHLGELFTGDEPVIAEQEENIITVDADQGESPAAEIYELPSANNEALIAENASKDDWISRDGHQRRENKGVFYRRRADFLVSKTDPDSSPMKRKDSKGSHLGYYDHYVVDGGRARIILNALVTPFEVTENQPMLDLLWRTSFRYKLLPKQVTGDTAYGTIENIAAVERMGIRAYVPLTGAGKARPYFSKEEFTYDPEQDLYRCPAGQTLRRFSYSAARRLTKYKADAATCTACSLREQCTKSKRGREVLRYYDEDYVDRVKGYFGTFAYQKALRKRKVWVEPMFAEAKHWHGLRRFRLRRLKKVNIEALLIAAGQNIKRLLTFGARRPKALAQAAALRPPDTSVGSDLCHAREHCVGSSWRPASPFLNRPASLLRMDFYRDASRRHVNIHVDGRRMSGGSRSMATSELEKITINMAPVDLGQIDLLVREGFYQSRTDFIRTAIRNQIGAHAEAVRQTVSRKELVLGLQHYTRDDLEAVRGGGETLQIRVLGLASIAEEVSPELALATIDSVAVLGTFRASREVKAALADRIRSS